MLKTDYSPTNSLILSYPKGFFKDYEALLPFYNELINIIPNDIKQYLIVNNEMAEYDLYKMFSHKNIQPILIEDFDDIWLRDILGFVSGNKIIKPIFKPDYYKNTYTATYLKELSKKIEEIIAKTIGYEIINIPLVMDCGNLITNGDIGFITDKIFRDNQDKDHWEIIEMIQVYFDIYPIFFETSKYDRLGHSDGYLAFLDKNTLCISEYPNLKFLKEDVKYLNKLERLIEAEDLELDLVKIFDRPVDEKAVYSDYHNGDLVYSARGNYINFLQINNNIVLPQFNLPTSKESQYYNSLNRKILSNHGKNVLPINTSNLSKLGGGIRCIIIGV